MAHSIRDKEGGLSVVPEEINDRQGSIFRTCTVSKRGENDLGELRKEQLRLDAAKDVITMDEIEMAVMKVKNRKSPGCDGLPVEIMRSKEVKRCMLGMFNNFWREKKERQRSEEGFYFNENYIR